MLDACSADGLIETSRRKAIEVAVQGDPHVFQGPAHRSRHSEIASTLVGEQTCGTYDRRDLYEFYLPVGPVISPNRSSVTGWNLLKKHGRKGALLTPRRKRGTPGLRNRVPPWFYGLKR